MFENLKEKTHRHKILATILFGMIILVFALWSYHPMSQSGGIGYAARVNHQIISIREYRDALDQTIAFYSQLFGGNFDAEAQQRMRVRSAALDQLINREAAIQAADSAGLKVTDEEVVDLITNVPAFQENGKFKREYYNNFLANRRLSAAQFESQIKRDIAFGKVRDLFQKSIQPAGIELAQLSSLGQEKFNLEFIRLENSQLNANIKVSPTEVAQFLGTPEGLKKAQDRFEANKASYKKEEQVHARHILIKVDPSKPNSDGVALAKIKAIAESLKTQKFEDVAKKESEDQGSKIKGGDLGFFTRGRMVKPFEEAAFSLPIGKVSDPIKTDFGYHLIKVEAKEAAQEADFEKVKTEIAREVLGETRASELSLKIAELAKAGKMAEATEMAKQFGGKWEETGPFSLADESIPKLGDDDAVFKAAAAVSEKDPFFKDVVSAGPVNYLIRFKSKVADAAKKPETEDSAKSRLASARSRDFFQKWSDSVVKSSKIEKNTAILEGEL